MQITRKLIDDTVTYFITGKFTYSYYQKFKSVIDEIKSNNLKEAALELSGVTNIDSLALGMILIAKDEAKKLGINIYILKPNKSLEECLNSASFSNYIEVRS
jgi:anti-anti-sigma factor